MKTRGLNIAINAQGARAPVWVHLVPAGKFGGRDGRGPWLLKDADAFIKATAAHQAGADLPLDYEHQSIMAGENGQPAPAAGWIKELASRADGIWGRVEWTERGAALVSAREYRYISPVFVHDKAGVLDRLDSAALVAQPNLQLTALNKQQGATMDEFLRQLAGLLGLADTASQEEIFAAVQLLKDGGGQEANADEATGEAGAPETLSEAEAALMEAVADLVDVAEEEATQEPNKVATSKAKAANAKIAAAFTAMNKMGSRLAALEGEVAMNKAEKVINAAMAAGKVTPAMREWALNYAVSDPVGFGGFIKTAPVIIAPNAAGGRDFGAPPRSGRDLTAEEKAVCKQLSISEADYLKSRNKEEVNLWPS